MERKRKLPPRAARGEHAAKRRNITPPSAGDGDTRSQTPQTVQSNTAASTSKGASRANTPRGENHATRSSNPAPQRKPPATSRPQAEDVSANEHAPIVDISTLSESLQRSRQRWLTGMFETYWTKPSKKKGAVEDPKNPPKDTMQRVGLVTITIEPHVFEATMFTVKDPRPSPATPTTRPYLQYGPRNGTMPPPQPVSEEVLKPQSKGSDQGTPVTVGTAVVTPALSSAVKKTPQTTPLGSAVLPSPAPAPVQNAVSTPATKPNPIAAPLHSVPSGSANTPINMTSSASASAPSVPVAKPPIHVQSTPPVRGLVPGETTSLAPQPPTTQLPTPTPPSRSGPIVPVSNGSTPSIPTPPTLAPLVPATVKSSAAAPQTNGALRKPHVTGIPSPAMQRPGVGPLSKPGPANIAAPVGSGPAGQTPAPATPPVGPRPPGHDPIIVTLAERAATDEKLRDLMKRVAAGEAKKDELTHFQSIIDKITSDHQRKGSEQGPSADRLIVEGKSVQFYSDEVNSCLAVVLQTNPTQRGADLKTPPDSHSLVVALLRKALDDPATKQKIERISQGKPLFRDATDLKATIDGLRISLLKPVLPAKPQQMPAPSSGFKAQTPAASSGQALRSKGPVQVQPPVVKRDIANVIFEFVGGTGDRYLFPTYSLVESQANGSQVVVSFLIVRKGSLSEYGGDPTLDYYQPVTIRIHAQMTKHLEPLFKVVRPRDEVQRYMEDVMDNMTRAEYVLLSMLPLRNARKEVTGVPGESLNKSSNTGLVHEETETEKAKAKVNGEGQQQDAKNAEADHEPITNGVSAGKTDASIKAAKNSASKPDAAVVALPTTTNGLARGGPAMLHQPAVLWKGSKVSAVVRPLVRGRSAMDVDDDDNDGEDKDYQRLIAKVAQKPEEVS